MEIDEAFHTAYRQLEEWMKALAEADGDVFLQMLNHWRLPITY